MLVSHTTPVGRYRGPESGRGDTRNSLFTNKFFYKNFFIKIEIGL